MRYLARIDWILLGSAFLLSCAGLASMYEFGADSSFAERQILWLALALTVFFVFAGIDFRFLRRTGTVIVLYAVSLFFLILLFVAGSVFQGAQSWFDLGSFSIQPSDPAKFALIVVLAKYFSRRHIEIARIQHIAVSGIYALIVFALLFFQPDFGSAMIIFALWAGIVLIAGIPFRHLATLAGAGALVAVLLWTFALVDYQKERILSFIHPLADLQGAGYNAFQSTVAVGSGGLFGKGIGYGTQSRLQFLPEHETDFIFAAFAEEWGFIGTMLLLGLFSVLIYRLIENARQGSTNFETLFSLGVATLFIVHAVIHVGMNIGLLPVTGVTMPFMSYGGSHLLTEYAMLGIVSAMRMYSRAVHEDERHEVVGVA